VAPVEGDTDGAEVVGPVLVGTVELAPVWVGSVVVPPPLLSSLQPATVAAIVAAVEVRKARRSKVLLEFMAGMVNVAVTAHAAGNFFGDCTANSGKVPSLVTPSRKNMRKIAIVGAGSAGLLTAAHLCTWLDNSWQVCVVHNPRKKILGIGESTNGAFISVLERATNFSIAHTADLDALDATVKYGSKFVGWRTQDWINPLLSGNVAIHFNNRRFKDFVFQRLSEIWGDQFCTLEADVQRIQNYADHATLVTDRGEHDFDFVVDCMGAPTSFESYTMSDCTLIDRCRIHTVENCPFEPFTDHIATQNGWMFGVPLKGRKTYGYLYSQKFTSDAQAEADLQRMLGVSSLESGEYDERYAFRCYYANELISGRVAKNGNKALFFEPLLANSMFLYVYASRIIYDQFVTGQDVHRCNGLFSKAVREMEDVISYYYRGGSTFDTPFWQAAATSAQTRLERRSELRDYFSKLATLKKKGTMYGGPPYAFSPHTWQLVDAQMGYDSFETA
jgi:hypothetical protein